MKDWTLGKKLGKGLCGVVVHGTLKGNEEKKVCFSFLFFYEKGKKEVGGFWFWFFLVFCSFLSS